MGHGDVDVMWCGVFPVDGETKIVFSLPVYCDGVEGL